MTDKDFRRNNLDGSLSPYLLQHTANPVWWQEWNSDVLGYAGTSGKPVLVSVGYSTCHWCHVMASEAFSDMETARFLNDFFVCIKVDREQRPDIDQFMMDFINSQNGRGGWPLNVFLTPGLKPVFALTYAPPVNRNSTYSFLEIARKVYEFILENGSGIPDFSPFYFKPQETQGDELASQLLHYFDDVSGGFGTGQKFPSHSTLLFMLYSLSAGENQQLRDICLRTLDAIRLRGLTDHLQGGIFRYCTDREWTIPHFEKMLYDQALSLWVYSLAFKVLGKESYRSMALGIMKCLDESFEKDGLFITAHDADTAHSEGLTYLWHYEELFSALGEEDFRRFTASYEITRDGNFEGMSHLIRKNDSDLTDIETRLLHIRRQREQPSADDKIVCGLNGLVAIAFIQASRLLGIPEAGTRAAALIEKLLSVFSDHDGIYHSCRHGVLQKQAFLSDVAPLLAAVTMLREDNKDWEDIMDYLAGQLLLFRDGDRWIESRLPDFKPVFASWFDHPVPSSASLAEFSLVRYACMKGRDYSPAEYLLPYHSDFYNVAVMLANGLFHVCSSPEVLPWDRMPANALQVRSEIIQDCYKGVCYQGLNF